MKTYKRTYVPKKQFPYRYLIIFGIIITIGIIGYFQKERIQLLIKGYNLTEQNLILSLDDKDIKTYLQNDKISNLETWQKTSNQKHYQDYDRYQKQHPQVSSQDVVKYIDQFYDQYYQPLSKLQYPQKVLYQMMETATLTDFQSIVQQQLSYQDTQKYLEITGLVYNDLKKYIQSGKSPLDAVLSISYPFIISTNKINRTYQINNPSDIALLIKKGFQLPSDYIPKDLQDVTIPIAKDCDDKQLRKAAANALEKMYQDALKEDLHLALNSGYRSFQQQKAIYDDYFKKYDEVTASGLVAVPGSSEHQLGLSVDLTSQSVMDGKWRFFGDTPEYQWVIKNAYQYGFILRYPQNKSKITGTTNEPWHFRYVGTKIAKIIYENNWTLEDYVLHYGLSSSVKVIK